MNQRKSKQHIYALAGLCLALFAHLLSFGQEARMITLKGRVTDQWGVPLVGVNLVSDNGKNGTSTDKEGNFELKVNDGSPEVRVEKRGLLTQKIACVADEQMTITLQPDMHDVDKVVDLGYATQRRGALSGAVATVYGEELERAPVANLSLSLAGRLPGLLTQEMSSELSRANTNMYIRGVSAARDNGPLTMIDGIITSYNANQTMEYISANEIESISVLKDAASQAMYGTLGANGILVITTKRGQKGPLRISATLDQAVQQVTTKPTFMSAAQYATLRNQAAVNDGISPFYTDEEIGYFGSGSDRALYPDNNWYDYYMKNGSNMQRAGVNVSGGSDRITFYSNVNVMHQGGLFHTDQPEYRTDPYSFWVNYRSNVDMKINNYLSAYVRLAGNVKREHTPGSGVADVYGSIFQLPPTMYGPVTPDVIDPETGLLTESSGQVITTQLVGAPVYGKLNRSGYANHTVTNITSQFGLNMNLDFLTKGLKINGLFAYQTNSVGSLNTLQNYERWERDLQKPDELVFIRRGEDTNNPLSYSKGSSHYYHLTYNGVLKYQRSFGLHDVSGAAYAYYQNLTKANTNSPDLLPYNRFSSGLDANYGYDNRYFLRAVLSYSGSEQFSPQNRYTFVPAFSAAWTVSNETFLADNPVLSNLHVRAAWGKTANDLAGLARYSYLDNVSLSGGGPLAYLRYLISENSFGNPSLSAEISTKKNLGLDVGLFNSLNLSVDLFKERMNNMFISAVNTVPSYQGIPLGSYPAVNGGIFENKGYEISADYRRIVNKDLQFNVGGSVSYTKNKVFFIDEAERMEDYAYRYRAEGYSFGQDFGFLVDYSNGNGYFNSAEELAGNTLRYQVDPRVGDLKFIDLNEDGILDEKDTAPLGTGAMPKYVYAFFAGANYKGFDANLLFQGIGNFERFIGGMGVWETDFDGVFTSLHEQAWTAERYANGEAIAYPALSTRATSSHVNSSFNVFNRSYLRLKNIEIGYTLAGRAAQAIGAHKVRFKLSGQNLFTWHHMKTDDFGPEGGGLTAIPVYRVYNIGVNLYF